MDWSAMFAARVVVLGCGNTLFGDDGLAPKAVCLLAKEAKATGHFAEVAFIDAGTSVRGLLTDLALCPSSTLQRLIVVDVVQEAARAAGSIAVEYFWAHEKNGEDSRKDQALAMNTVLHLAPTRALLQHIRATMDIELMLVTVQAACIPPLMDDTLSPSALTALPLLQECLRQLCATGMGQPLRGFRQAHRYEY